MLFPENERNALLRALPTDVQTLFAEAGREEVHRAGSKIYELAGAVEHIYFPRTAVFSLLTQFADGRVVESASVGFEGICGLELLLGAKMSSQEVICQIAGSALCVPAAEATSAFATSLAFRQIVHRYAAFSMTTMSQSAGCLALHTVAERCARWLLVTHDRIDGDHFHLTHEFLSAMMGVNRPTVTIAAGALQAAGLISYRRGAIAIKDRSGLEDASCECYGTLRDARHALFESVRQIGATEV